LDDFLESFPSDTAPAAAVPDYKNLVQRNCSRRRHPPLHGRAIQPEARFVLELMVVVILIIKLVYFFRGKPI